MNCSCCGDDECFVMLLYGAVSKEVFSPLYVWPSKKKLVIPWYLNFASYYGMFGTSPRQNFNFKISIGYF
jgi:hypothetical protein